ncbi:hypothetical protein NUW58_g8073 [Xylaria curta]|uniref:Uncharacterized protein n=1 Tax=Xylaria curta TaxID=42375 RepID=A0ACC1NBP7_9PEZI|nr:hypothetical protein NUW58_g8073 [Xylaria curta]
MAAPEPSQRVADIRRRAAENPDVAFRAFDTYPWQADQIFNRRLVDALYAVEPEGSLLAEAALQMRIDRFAERINIQIDKDAYIEYRSRTDNVEPRLFSDQTLAQEVEAKVPLEQRRLAILHAKFGYPPHEPAPEPIDPSVPSWQRAAPKAELFVPKNAGPSNAGGGALPYPKKFEQIVKFLETGQAIPGVRQIPDTVINDPSISTRGSMQAPLKPWERNSESLNANTEQNVGVPSNDTTIVS